MSQTKSAALVAQAELVRPARLTKSLESFAALRDGFNTDSQDRFRYYRPWAQALNAANVHITVRPEEISAATDAYKEVGEHLAANLSWPRDSILIQPQGSVSTQTLIRSPNGNEKFDIDAVCQVDISHVEAADPMGFFQSVGFALQELEAEAKKRCWNIPFTKQPFYLEFTPSVPMESVSIQTQGVMAPRYRAAQQYDKTALAVVDTPTKSWKTSNPAGMTKWVDDTAKRSLIQTVAVESFAVGRARADIAPVPEQTVEITDTLRVAIRLFKRHRDMCVRRSVISPETKPISIIIVTLLTACYEGLADLNRTFEHPVELMDELAALMPHLLLKIGNEYHIDNPTVEGENFAEKWNHDGGERYRSFITWCKVLSADLKTILALTDPQAISKRVHEVFGIPVPTSGDVGLHTMKPPTLKVPPAGRGLA
ncbi:nucleotidyltransferase domain-containing protein [Nitrincola sp. MINF-07-Sa-05]|uniref:nucleotidyltransferase domain-containing protein n=1 Tax=Nitrincola salilacus TaxID=3400273 RepID=UPI003918025A